MFGSKHTTITDQRTYVVDDDLVEDIAEYMFDDADDDSLPKPDDAELKMAFTMTARLKIHLQGLELKRREAQVCQGGDRG